jgi:hypothetical protein
LNQNKLDRESFEPAPFSIFNSTFSILRQWEQAFFLLENEEFGIENGELPDFFPRHDLIAWVLSRRSQDLKWRKIHVASKCHGDAAASPANPVDFEPVGAAVHSCGGGAADS